MMRKVSVWAVLTTCLLAAGVAAASAEEAGYVLLEKMTSQFAAMAKYPPPAERTALDEQRLSGSLNDMMASARLAKAEKRIDGPFFDRYARLVRVLRVLTFDDPQGILLPLFEPEVNSFVRGVLGPGAAASGRAEMGEIARTFTMELESLKKQLDAR